MAEYEKILKFPRDTAVNNLAALLTEVGGDKAYSFLDTLGWVYFMLGRYDSAVPLLQKAVAQAPQVPAFQYHLGMTLYKQGDMKSAKSHLQLAVDAKVNFPGLEQANALLAKI